MQEQVVVDLAVEVDLFLHPVDRMEGVPPFASFPVELRTAVDDTFHVELIGREEEANHRTAVVGLPPSVVTSTRGFSTASGLSAATAIPEAAAQTHASQAKTVCIISLRFQGSGTASKDPLPPCSRGGSRVARGSSWRHDHADSEFFELLGVDVARSAGEQI